MTRTLYAITDDLLRLNDLLEGLEGDLSNAGVMEGAVTFWLESLEQEQAAKLDSYVGLLKTLRMEATAAKAEKEQWAMKERIRTNRADYLERRLKEHLEKTGQTKVQTASGRVVSVVKNGGVAPVEIKAGVVPTDVPADFQKVTVEIDKAAVRAALTAGQELAFAELLPRGTHLKVA
jgi:hypothetical protein